MRAKDFITEYTEITRSKLTGSGKENEDRVGKFIELITSGFEFNSKQGPVTVDVANIPAIQQFFAPGNSQRSLNIKTNLGIMPMSNLYYNDSAWRGTKSRGTADISLKPSQIWDAQKIKKGEEVTPELAVKMGAFPASELGQRIISSTVLDQQGAAGAVVKQMAKQIMDGQIPTVTEDLSKQEFGAIQNDAFEYLGVLAMINGVAEFPDIEAFYTHLGAKLNEFMLFFPGSTSSPLADSFALQNSNTGNTIFLSSKGGKSGSPSSINELKIPAHMLQTDDDAIEFVQLLQSTAPMFQPFVAANWLHTNYPGSLGQLEKFMPFDDAFFEYISSVWKNKNKGVPTTLEEIPAEYQPLFSYIQAQDTNSKKPWNAPLFYYVRYIVKSAVHDAIRSKRAIPQFSQRMIEVFGWNFVVVKTKPKGDAFITSCQWPAKVGGTVSFEHKDPAPKWTSAMTWLLS
jgi:hypothetical protein